MIPAVRNVKRQEAEPTNRRKEKSRVNLSQISVVAVVQSLSHVQPSVTPWTVARQAPLSTGILQARILEWVAMPSSRGFSQPRDGTQVSCIAGGFCTI